MSILMQWVIGGELFVSLIIMLSYGCVYYHGHNHSIASYGYIWFDTKRLSLFRSVWL